MTSRYESLSARGQCEKCGHINDLVELRSNGESYELCHGCATSIQVGRVA